MLGLRLGNRKVTYFCSNLCTTQYILRYYSDKKPKDPNLYDSLGIKSSASSGEIKQAYYDLSFKYHPDRNKGNVEASNKFREVTEAYEVLGNYGLRKRYDKGLPLSMKKGTTSRKPIEETPVKYQSFFDSRTSSQKNKTQFQSLGSATDLHDFSDGKNQSERSKMLDEKFDQSAKLSWLMAFFLLTLLIAAKSMKD